jgi:hypothetical protein
VSIFEPTVTERAALNVRRLCAKFQVSDIDLVNQSALKSLKTNGGSEWESNPPEPGKTRLTPVLKIGESTQVCFGFNHLEAAQKR